MSSWTSSEKLPRFALFFPAVRRTRKPNFQSRFCLLTNPRSSVQDSMHTVQAKITCSDERTQGHEAYRLRKRPPSLQTVQARDLEKNKSIQGKDQGYV